jgi:hypothetical protein
MSEGKASAGTPQLAFGAAKRALPLLLDTVPQA